LNVSPFVPGKGKKKKAEKSKRNKANISDGLMTLQPVLRSSLHVQRGGGERGQGATQPARGGEKEMDRDLYLE